MAAPTLPTDRERFRAIVQEVAEQAKVKLPEANGRVDKAVAIVLQGDVELCPDGTAIIRSQSNGTTEYVACNGTCECKDYPRAPSHFCKHRIALGILKRAQQRMPLAPESGHEVHPMSTPLPEAPASVNLKAMVGNYEVMITLRGTDESALLERLGALLKRSDLRPVSKPTPRSGGWKRQYQGRA